MSKIRALKSKQVIDGYRTILAGEMVAMRMAASMGCPNTLWTFRTPTFWVMQDPAMVLS